MIKKISKKKIAGILLAVCLIALLPAGTVHAADFSQDGVVDAGEVIEDDVFLSSEQCEMNGTINGNLVATCQHITLNGAVTGDAFLFAETITVGDAAKVDGNLFAFGADVKIDGNISGSAVSAGQSVLLDDATVVGRNLYFAGYQGEITEGASIGMDVYGGANQIIMNGTVARDLTVGVNAFELRGNIGRDASIHLGTGNEDIDTSLYSAGINYYPENLPAGMRFYEGASIGNNLTYTATENMDAQFQDYVQGKIVFDQITATDNNLSKTGTYTGKAWFNEDFSQFRVTSAFSRMISYFALGALAFWLAKKQVVRVRESGIAFPGKAFGWGFVAILVGMMSLILVPGTFILLGILLGVISLGGLLFAWYGVVGLIIALVFALFFLVAFTLSKVVAAYVFGSWLMQDVFKTKTQNRWIDLLVGVLFYVILRAIPFVGWVVGLAASLYGTGALFIAYSKVEKKKEKKAVETK